MPGCRRNSGPVFYAARSQFVEKFRAFAEGIERHGDYIAGLGAEQARRHLCGSFCFAALATKHPGFAEEREWRIVHNPHMHPAGGLPRSVEMFRNEPQIVYKLPLQSRPAAGITGLDLRECLESVIIGPCQNPQAVREAFAVLLGEAGVAEPEARIRVSRIPMR